MEGEEMEEESAGEAEESGGMIGLDAGEEEQEDVPT